MSKYFHLIVLNLPLIGEVVRKYAIQNDFVFLAADTIALVTFTALVASGRLRGHLPSMFYWLVPVFLMWVFMQQAVTGHNIGIMGVGMRAAFLPLIYLFLSASFASRYPDGIKLLFVCATAWVTVAGCMAIAQIYLGPSHPINAVWGAQALGAGDYVGADHTIAVKGLFRPTSIFTHTGKFGQVAFLLVLFRWSVHAFSRLHLPKWTFAFVLVDLATVFASGQRAAFVFLILSIVGMAYFARRGTRGALVKWSVGVTAMAALVGILILVFPTYGGAVGARFASGLADIPARLNGNLWLPIGSIVKDHLIFGEGFGYFTFGAQLFGGKVAYSALTLEGLGESSFIRVCGEIGFLGALLFGAMFFSIFLRALRRARVRSSTQFIGPTVFYVLWIGSLVLWCNTADVFGNTVGIFTGCALSGTVLLSAKRFKDAKVAA